MATDDEKDVKVRHALSLQRYSSLNEAVSALAERTNEHALLIMGLMKKLGVSPDDLLALLKPQDFVNPADNGIINEPNGKISLS